VTSRRRTPLTWFGIALIVAIALLVIFGVLSLSTYGGYYGLMGSGAWGWGVAMMAVPGILLVLILVAALGGLEQQTSYAANPAYLVSPSPTELLDQRYARGELGREDYLRMRADLVRGRAPP